MKWLLRSWWPILLLYTIVAIVWAVDSRGDLTSDISLEANPLPIEHMIHIANRSTGEETVWYAAGPDLVFPTEGVFVFTRWSLVDGTVIYKARITVGKGVIVYPTDRDVDDPGGG